LCLSNKIEVFFETKQDKKYSVENHTYPLQMISLTLTPS